MDWDFVFFVVVYGITTPLAIFGMPFVPWMVHQLLTEHKEDIYVWVVVAVFIWSFAFQVMFNWTVFQYVGV